MIELVDTPDPGARIKVIGAGGCGGNAVSHMIKQGLHGVRVHRRQHRQPGAAQQHCADPHADRHDVTRGLGTGGNPEIGRKAALEDEERLREVLADAEMVFVTAGMGGGTGTGAAPGHRAASPARRARSPSAWSPSRSTSRAAAGCRRPNEGLRELQDAVDTLITIPNQRLLSRQPTPPRCVEAFRKADDVLLQAVQGISRADHVHGLINVDFADVKTSWPSMGRALMGIGSARARTARVEAAQHAIASRSSTTSLSRARRGVLINITGGPDMSLHEVEGGGEPDPGGGPRGREHHLRRGDRRAAGRRNPHHGDRDWLRRPGDALQSALLVLGRASTAQIQAAATRPVDPADRPSPCAHAAASAATAADVREASRCAGWG